MSQKIRAVRAVRAEGIESFRDWYEAQDQNKLITDLAKALKRRYPVENYDECVSMVGICLARWLAEGTLDRKIAERGDMSISLLLEWIRLRHLNEVYSRGKEPILRNGGARTNSERSSTWRDGNKHGMAEESTQSAGWEVAVASGDDEDSFEFEVICRNSDPEEATVYHRETLDVGKAHKAIIEALYPGASARYVSVLKILSEGGDRVTISESEKCSVVRAGHLACRVRGAIKRTVEISGKVRQFIKDEPWSTCKDIAEELGMDRKEVDATVAYLTHKGELVSRNGGYKVV
jgi:hypothetical protein